MLCRCRRQKKARDKSEPLAKSAECQIESPARAKDDPHSSKPISDGKHTGGRGGLANCLVGFSCFGGREQATPQDADAVKVHNAATMKAAGVPKEAAEGVAKLASALCITGPEPLSDPLTLLRFYRARDGDVDLAAQMYRDSIIWRASFSIREVMLVHGAGEQYSKDGKRDVADFTRWAWQRGTATRAARWVQDYGFWGRLTAPEPLEGAPVAVWRLGACDLAGYAREDIIDVLVKGFIAHLEDLLQASRALSRREGRLIRCRMIIDLQGLGAPIAVLKHRGVLKKFMALGKAYYPEVNTSVTLVRAPGLFSRIFAAVKPSLTQVMQRKICILGEDFEAGLREHAGVELSTLPQFLGGAVSNDQVGYCSKVPHGLSKQS